MGCAEFEGKCVPPPPASTVLNAQLSAAMVINFSVFCILSYASRSSSVNPGGRGSLPGIWSGTRPGKLDPFIPMEDESKISLPALPPISAGE